MLRCQRSIAVVVDSGRHRFLRMATEHCVKHCIEDRFLGKLLLHNANAKASPRVVEDL